MRGGDTGRLRSYNERIIMSSVLRAGALSKAEIARETGLSGQAASVIVNRLIGDGMLVKRPKVRGQVGQPSTPVAANPEGAFSLGVKIGRRSCEAVLVNILGDVIGEERELYAAPFPEPTMAIVVAHATRLLAKLQPHARSKVVGLGIAMPGEIHSWADELDLPPAALAGWRTTDPVAALQDATGLSTALHNDATAACAAEMIAGHAITSRSALYIYIGTFVGGGVVLDGRLYSGEQANAGAIGSMPTGDAAPGTAPAQLIHNASLITLERALQAARLDPVAVLAGNAPRRAEAIFHDWLEKAVPELARAAVSALSVLDFQTIVLDGLLPPPWRDEVARRLVEAMARFNLSGLVPARVVTGSIGPLARVLGAALLPLHARFSADVDILVH